MTWSAVLCLHQALRIYHYRGYINATPEDQADDKWAHRYTFATTAAGAVGGDEHVLHVDREILQRRFARLAQGHRKADVVEHLLLLKRFLLPAAARVRRGARPSISSARRWLWLD